MSTLRLLADDLTGALDSAAPFAAAGEPLSVRWFGEADGAAVHPGGEAAWVVSTASRDLPEQAAVARVAALAPALMGGSPAFKKIDSLLRGNTVAEIVAAHRAGGFARTLVTPAFPAQGRRVRAGRLVLRAADGTETAGPDLAGLLAAAGADPAITVCDAETEADLAALVASHRSARGLLWAGAGGLARALCPPAAPCALPEGRPVLVVTASLHGVTRAQLAAIAAPGLVPVLRDDGLGDAAAVGQAVAHRLASRLSSVLDASPPGPVADPAARAAACFAPLVAAPPPGLLIVAGGDTLGRLLAALGCTRLALAGEVAPGLPLSVLQGGVWDGVSLVSKSGAFEDDGVMARAIAAAAGRE
ncbi:MAG: hypothetical protein MUC89_01440 [Acetobacteraceae bacterium]|jgi:uncharacterized protein YgbK (DUF1537 family)|nr:hypothetical protein [Acetobacteraceae bacterium]